MLKFNGSLLVNQFYGVKEEIVIEILVDVQQPV
jgi:hypothetical protein